MFKWIKLIRFIRKYRKLGIASFRITTNADTIVIYPADTQYDDDDLRLKY
jgi:hypothetical protein